ncbi:MAG: hypothetical protein KZQ73_02565 [Candidatus Thiodiazotropha sp. (ex Semelilucina semeliformis)]|nr:hypothetical protein [Candidatus Thiodiazotropha sp. (ex Semelilucina semeliformis)]
MNKTRSNNRLSVVLKSLSLLILLSSLVACGGGGGGNVVNDSATHSIGGTVSGLSGTLVLQNNGGDSLTLTQNGDFLLPTLVAVGDSYSLSISSQPAGQQCSLSNPSGIVNATISDIGVVCVDWPLVYSIGGTVSGLNGSLVLQNNEVDDLTLTQNGDFSFPTPVVVGDSYSLSISSQPAGQQCSLNNPSGIVNAAVSDIDVTCVDRPVVSYSISGEVNGLSGTLVLQNSGGDNLTLVSDGTFTIDTQVFEGDSYNISISSQPSGQLCSLSNGTGPEEGHVLDISVVCSEPRNIGGTVSGLNGTLVLQNDGGNDLMISQDGNFTFPTQLPDGARYSVRVFAQPNSQDCKVANGGGTVSGDINNVTVTCDTLFNIGGTVSGLNAAGLTLSLNGSSAAISIAQDGVYSAGRLFEGTPYYVKIESSPRTQQCDLSNGVGTLTGDVTDINITCIDLPLYNIGGTVSGLIGTLVLQNNGGDDVTLNSDGDFIFSTQIVEGASYQVSVNAQPSGQICTVSNGVDTATGTVSDISVVCGIPFNLSGTVSGLSGSLVLQNNGSDDLSIDSDGGFTFTTQVAQGSNYEVSVLNRPGNQQCNVVDGSGTVAGDIDTVQITCTDLLTLTGKLGEGQALDVAVQGGYAYVAADSGLLVLDISDPANSVSVTFYETSVRISEVELSGSYAFVTGYAGLAIVDISNPAMPIEVGSTAEGVYFGNVRDLALNGNLAYVVSGPCLHIIDTADPSAPTEVGSACGLGWAYDVAVSGSYAYVADYLDGLHIVDVSDPAIPTEVSLLGASQITRVVVIGDHAYVTSYAGLLLIFDISDPVSPSQIGSISTGRIEDFSIRGDYAYVMPLSGPLVIFDISIPAVPIEVGSHAVTFWHRRVEVDGDYAYVLPEPSAPGGEDIAIIDISDPTTPVSVGSYPVNEGYLASPESMVVTDGYAYIANRGAGLTIVSVSDPALPTRTTTYSPGGQQGHDVFVNGGYAYIVAGSRFDIADVTNPALPTNIGSLGLGGWNYDVAVSGTYAYVADYLNGLHILDVGDPTLPSEVSLLELTDHADSLAIVGGYVYANNYMGIPRIIDISEPSAPSDLGLIPYISGVNHMLTNGEYAYVATTRGLRIFDISNPLLPVELAELDVVGGISNLALSGNYLYLANVNDGLRIVDIMDPTAPLEVAHQATLGTAAFVDVVGDHVYVSEQGYGLEIFQTFLP